MRKKTKAIIGVLWVALVLFICILAGSFRAEKGTIRKFVDNAVIIASDDGKSVTLIEDYHTYIPDGEQWLVGDRVKIRDGLFSELRIYRLEK